MFKEIEIEEYYCFESDVESHINADDLSELSGFFDEEDEDSEGNEMSNSSLPIDDSTPTLSIDDITYSRDLRYINVPMASRPRPAGVLYEVGTASRILKQVRDVTGGNAGELKDLDSHYKKLDERKRLSDSKFQKPAGEDGRKETKGDSFKRGKEKPSSKNKEGKDRRSRRQRERDEQRVVEPEQEQDLQIKSELSPAGKDSMDFFRQSGSKKDSRFESKSQSHKRFDSQSPSLSQSTPSSPVPAIVGNDLLPVASQLEEQPLQTPQPIALSGSTKHNKASFAFQQQPKELSLSRGSSRKKQPMSRGGRDGHFTDLNKIREYLSTNAAAAAATTAQHGSVAATGVDVSVDAAVTGYPSEYDYYGQHAAAAGGGYGGGYEDYSKGDVADYTAAYGTTTTGGYEEAQYVGNHSGRYAGYYGRYGYERSSPAGRYGGNRGYNGYHEGYGAQAYSQSYDTSHAYATAGYSSAATATAAIPQQANNDESTRYQQQQQQQVAELDLNPLAREFVPNFSSFR